MRRSWISRLWSQGFDFMATTGWPRLMVFATWLTLLTGSYWALMHPPQGVASARSEWATHLLLTLAIALPNLLLFVLARILLYRFSKRRFSLVDAHDGAATAGPEIPAHAIAQAHALWAYERERTQTRYFSNLLPQIAVFGLIASATIAGCVLALHGVFGALSGGKAREAVASVLAAATTALLLTIGRLLMRIASNDATNRTFAHEARSFVFCLLSGVLFGCLMEGTSSTLNMSSAVAIGVGIGILGDRAFLAASQRAALLIGADGPAPTQALDLRLIEGLSPDDLSRLQEENISTVHALAFVPAPRLFFNSSLNFQRICDWQDQALLIEFFGETKAKVLREQVQIRGVTDALALTHAREHELKNEDDWKEFVADLGFRGDAHARFLFEKLKTDETVAVLRAYRRMALAIETIPVDGEVAPEAGPPRPVVAPAPVKIETRAA